LLAAAVWPAVAFNIDQKGIDKNHQAYALAAPGGSKGWILMEKSEWNWRPRIVGADRELYRFYVKDNVPVGLYLGHYLSQRQGAELVNSINVMVVQKHPVWSNKGEQHPTAKLGDQQLRIVQNKIVSPTNRLLVWHWFRIGGRYTSNPYTAKLLEAWNRLTGSRRDAAMIVIATPYDIELEAGAEQLQEFVDAMLPQIERVLDTVVGEG
jgi:EpsI family protein